MPVSGSRVLALQRRKHRILGNFHKTVHLEQVTLATGNSDYRPGASTTIFSILIDPPPVVRLTSEEDIAQSGQNVAMEDLVFEIHGDATTEANLRAATRVVLNKGLSDEEKMTVQQIRPATWIQPLAGSYKELSVVAGQVQRWLIFARSTKKAA